MTETTNSEKVVA